MLIFKLKVSLRTWLINIFSFHKIFYKFDVKNDRNIFVLSLYVVSNKRKISNTAKVISDDEKTNIFIC